MAVHDLNKEVHRWVTGVCLERDYYEGNFINPKSREFQEHVNKKYELVTGYLKNPDGAAFTLIGDMEMLLDAGKLFSPHRPVSTFTLF